MLPQTSPKSDNYSAIVSSVMEIDEITWGDPKKRFWESPSDGFIVRFRGRLLRDVPTARVLLRRTLEREHISPIIFPHNNQYTILLIHDPLTTQIAPLFEIQETHWGSPEAGYIVRFLGRLKGDSAESYARLSEDLSPQGITPLFRNEKQHHAIILVPQRESPKKANPWVNLIMFLLTLLSVALVGSLNAYEGPVGESSDFLREVILNIWRGWPFAASLLGILLAHEFGHYIAARLHKTKVTLPYFMPLPLPPFGTLGAFIQLKEPPKNKRVLLDIGVAGPLAGLIVAIPVLLLGLRLSHLDTIPRVLTPGQGLQMEGNSILYLLAKYLVFGEWLPTPRSFGSVSPLFYWIRYFFTGTPAPLGGRDVLIHPVALAGWGGLLVTSLNLIPAGQLDGGHLIYVLLGKHARLLLPLILISLFGLGLVWPGWWLWALIISLLGRTYAEPLDQITPLNPSRKALAILGLIIFILVFTPVPLRLISGPLA